MIHPLAGRKQSPEHIANRVAACVVGEITPDRVTYFVRDWSKHDPDTGTLPEWKEHSYDPNDSGLVAWLTEIAERKGEIRTATESSLLERG